MVARGSSGSSSSGTAAEVEALIAEAADLVALEEIARLNSAHLADDALLPADVESRFRRLKTFPAPSEARTIPAPPGHCSSNEDLGEPAEPEPKPKLLESDPSVDKDVGFEAAATVSPVKPAAEKWSGNGTLPSPAISPAAAAAASLSPQGSSPSPPRGRACCFGFSPRKGDSGNKRGRVRRGDVGFRKGDNYGSLLSDLGTFSLREQRRTMRRAMREEEKVLQEAQRMVKWVKQASARMDVSATTVDELLSDLEDEAKSK